MSDDPSELQDRVRAALGSARVVPVQAMSSGGPLDLLALQFEVGRIRPRPPRMVVQATALLGDTVFEGLERAADCLEAA